MNKVKPGDPLTIAAATWNALIDTANYVATIRQNQSTKGVQSAHHTGIVLVRNDTGVELAQFSALALSNIAVSPTVDADAFCHAPPVFLGTLPTDPEAPYVITQEPIAPNAIGRAMILGVTPAQVNILAATDTYVAPTATGTLDSAATGSTRILWKPIELGLQWCLMQLGGASAGGASPGIVSVYNGGNTEVAANSITMLSTLSNPGEVPGATPTFLYAPSTDPEAPFAIIQAPIAPQSTGTAIALGLAIAKVQISSSSNTHAIATASGTLASSDSGPARILWKSMDSGTPWCILLLGGSGAAKSAPPAYNSYFALRDATTTNSNGSMSYKVAVVDGATYESGSSNPSVCKVNNTNYSVAPTTLDISASRVSWTYIYLKYTNISGQNPAVELLSGTTIPSDTYQYVYYQIGRARVASRKLIIQQDHLTGIPRLWWYLLCSQD